MKKSNEISTLYKRLLMCILPFVLYLILNWIKLNNEADVKIIMRLALCAIAAYGGYLWYKGKLTAERVVTLIILAGIIVRAGYTTYTHAFARGHDIGANKPTGTGHWGYLYHVMNMSLPPSNEYQFYQQPLYYILSSVFIKVAMLFAQEGDWTRFLYMTQQVSCIASSVALVFLSETMKKLDIPHRLHIPAVALTAFYPVQILAAGRMNNDALVLMFMVLALYFTVAWNKERRIEYVIGLAMSIGMGMMTKINCGLIALVAGPTMLYHLIKVIRAKDNIQIKNLIIQFFVFAMICFPLALWYPIRNYIEFDQPLTYVYDIGENSFVYRGNANWADRWINVPFAEFVKEPYMNMSADKSIPMSFIKTGVHGEFSYENLSPLLAWGMEYLHTVILLMVFANTVFVALKYREIDKKQKYSVLGVWLLTIVSYIQFNIKYPYMCTADFRYLLLWQMASGVCIALFMDYCNRKREIRAYRRLLTMQSVLIGLFCIGGIMHWC